MTQTTLLYHRHPEGGLEVRHPDASGPGVVLPLGSEIAVLYEHAPEGSALQAHGSREAVEAAWRKMWAALMRSPVEGGRLGERLHLEVFRVADLDDARLALLNATLSGMAPPATLRERLRAHGLPDH